MTEFASAAMVRVLTQGMRDLGLQAPSGPVSSGARGATLDLNLKRQLVQSAVQQGGLECLPLLGRGLHRYAHEPTHLALTTAGEAADLFERWTRLERYIHSRHRIRVLSVNSDSATVQHVALGSKPPPLAAEDFVVLGVLAALLEAIGAQEVEVRAGKAAAYPLPDPTALAEVANKKQSSLWTWQWRLDAANDRRLQSTEPEPLGPPIDELVSAEPWPDLAKQAFVLIAEHLVNPLRVQVLASKLNTSSRTLQRALQRAELSCEGLLAEARSRCSAWWLLHTPLSIAEVGFLTGYADQPHFTRDYKRRVGMTPGNYRREFVKRSGGKLFD